MEGGNLDGAPPSPFLNLHRARSLGLGDRAMLQQFTLPGQVEGALLHSAHPHHGVGHGGGRLHGVQGGLVVLSLVMISQLGAGQGEGAQEHVVPDTVDLILSFSNA